MAKTCQFKDPSLKISFDDYWENLKSEPPFKGVIPDDEVFTTETLKVFSFPKEASRQDVHDWLMGNGVILDIEKIIPTNTPTAWFLKHVGITNMKSLIERLHKKPLGKPPNVTKIQCIPVTLSTPQKEQFGLRPPQEASFDGSSSGSVQHLQPSRKDIMESSTSKGVGHSEKNDLNDPKTNTEVKLNDHETNNEVNHKETNTKVKSKGDNESVFTSVYNVFSNAWRGAGRPHNISTATTVKNASSTSVDATNVANPTLSDNISSSTVSTPRPSKLPVPKSLSKSLVSKSPSRLMLPKTRKAKESQTSIMVTSATTSEEDFESVDEMMETQESINNKEIDYMMSTGFQKITPMPQFDNTDISVSVSNKFGVLATDDDQENMDTAAGQPKEGQATVTGQPMQDQSTMETTGDLETTGTGTGQSMVEATAGQPNSGQATVTMQKPNDSQFVKPKRVNNRQVTANKLIAQLKLDKPGHVASENTIKHVYKMAARISDDWERERVHDALDEAQKKGDRVEDLDDAEDVIDQAYRTHVSDVNEENTNAHKVPEPVAYEVVKTQQKIKQNWYDSTDQDQDYDHDLPTHYETHLPVDGVNPRFRTMSESSICDELMEAEARQLRIAQADGQEQPLITIRQNQEKITDNVIVVSDQKKRLNTSPLFSESPKVQKNKSKVRSAMDKHNISPIDDGEDFL